MGVGAGNVPAYIHESANIHRAVNDVVLSKSFDNGMIQLANNQLLLLQKYMILLKKNLLG